jgi:hypothetical protein
MCEGKNANAYSLKSIERYIFTNPVKVSADSRRYVVMQVSSEMRGNAEYFTELSSCIDDPHTRHEFCRGCLHIKDPIPG